MALRLRKDVKKSSYYVWFLGAKESKGLRGSEYVLPVIQHLVNREKDIEPFKVTLQVSHKGLKIVQNVVAQGAKNSKPKNETIKHFIPHSTITCVYQHEDIIACILLLFNPVTKCPLHVHAYRCDSLETAAHLKQQLQTIVERPENQKKFAEIENRLKAPEVKKFDSSVGSDTGTSTRESESSEERYSTNDNTRVATLYDSVAAELRAKLNKNNVPILLPPRDYDTVHRQKGNLTGIELRRCLNSNIVGQNAKGGRRLESSGGSSGIGSDHAPSPDSPDAPDTRFNTLDNQSSSDEDWNAETGESSLYLMHGPSEVTLPRPSRLPDPEKKDKPPEHRKDHRYEAEKFYYGDYHHNSADKKKTPDPRKQPKFRKDPKHEKEKYSTDDGFDEVIKGKSKSDERRYYEEDEWYGEKEAPVPKTRQRFSPDDPRFYSDDRKNRYYQEEPSKYYASKESQFKYSQDYYEDPESRRRPELRQRSPPPEGNVTPRDRFKDAKEKFLLLERERIVEERIRKEAPISPSRKDKASTKRQDKFTFDEDEFFEERRYEEERKPRYEEERKPRYEDERKPRYEEERKPRYEEERKPRYEEERKPRYEDERKPRYEEERKLRYEEERKPKPAPRTLIHEEIRYRKEIPLERYRNADKSDPKRRSMFSLIEEEHKKNSNEIAKELKRRSYMDNAEEEYYRETTYNELPESERYSKQDRYHFSKSSVDLDKVTEMKFENSKYAKANQKAKNLAGYRHSYAEPKLKLDKNAKKFAEVLHRTNSSVSNTGRVGIASVHPY